MGHMRQPPPGWYQNPDPKNPSSFRWWDGRQWTGHVHDSRAGDARGGGRGVSPNPLAARRATPSGSATQRGATSPAGRASTDQPRTNKAPLGPSTFLVGGALAIIAIVGVSAGVGWGALTFIALILAGTGLYALLFNRPSWARPRSRTVGSAVHAGRLVVTFGAAAIAGPPETVQNFAEMPSASAVAEPAVPEPEPESATPSPSISPTPRAQDLDVDPLDPDTTTKLDGDPTVVIAEADVTSVRALELLATLETKGRAPKTGYSRDEFGAPWTDADGNGCDTRNDILRRDLDGARRGGDCRVNSGTLVDPYTGKTFEFERGTHTSGLVHIDHVVSLSDAWQKGAQALTPLQRVTFANDPMNLLAVEADVNIKKGAGDAATWLPPQRGFRCEYVSIQISVKATYGLWVTKAERAAMERILTDCPDQSALTSKFAPKPKPSPSATPKPSVTPRATPAPAPKPAPTSTPKPAPAPTPKPTQAPAPPPPPAPVEVYYQNCAAARAAGVTPIYIGPPGYGRHLDRDGDGIACE